MANTNLKTAQGQEVQLPENSVPRKKNVPEGLWTKCLSCSQAVYTKALRENLSVCPKCGYHFVISARDRIGQLIDTGTFREMDSSLLSKDPLGFKAAKSYLEKIKQDQKRTGLKEAVVIGTGSCEGTKIAFGVTDSQFIMGSMGSVVGEKITRLIEYAQSEELPLVIVSGSGGGARMYEGALSLMQMAKTSAALARFSRARLPYISVLTHPTMGGVMASFASLGDFIVAEPKALIGFAGPRVIEQTIRQKLPPDFQTSEFLLEHGLIDLVVPRKELKQAIARLIAYCT
ncbi:MAG: acetyl-CoA carboxylase carboxyltransferase subunit beta [Candidatus Omnitrophica bacterium]|nr:acetyl-CoA carboxylase carboxyltransferase subunit beta [Candidatus Omnitrophota bacterium]